MFAVFRKGLQRFGLDVIHVVIGRVGMAVDGFHIGQHEEFRLVVAQLVILHPDWFLLP